MPCAALAAEVQVSSYYFALRRICAPLAVYDERGRAVLLCCAPVLGITQVFSPIQHLFDYVCA
jgi:DMSO reductase anchor subunit